MNENQQKSDAHSSVSGEKKITGNFQITYWRTVLYVETLHTHRTGISRSNAFFSINKGDFFWLKFLCVHFLLHMVYVWLSLSALVTTIVCK